MKKINVFIVFLISCLSIQAQKSNSIADSNNVFAFKLYSELKNENKGNLFFSPFSISTDLALAYTGARNETEKQMSLALHFNIDQNVFNKDYRSYLMQIEADTGRSLKMEIANSIWVDNTCLLLSPFKRIVTYDYNSVSKNVDFMHGTEQARQDINSWVESKTHGKINDLIGPGALNRATRLVLVNAIYFKGKWRDAFLKTATKKDTFFEDVSNHAIADFMNKTTEYKYYGDNNLQAIEIPYAGDTTSMIVFLPRQKDGINSLEQRLNYSYYSQITQSLSSHKVILKLPKFKETNGYGLNEPLKNMGMAIAFTDSADFRGIAIKPVKIYDVVHKAFIDVSEEGTEAAAATGTVMNQVFVVTQEPPKEPPPIPFIANHPFIFIIRDNATNSILFMGKITEPPKE